MKKEQFEWIHSWCDENNKNDLPRVLLIGDSITHNYQEIVRSNLKNICYVDYVSTSYSLDNPIYTKLVKEFIKNSNYDLIHFNYGLHGIHISLKSFEKKMTKLLNDIKKENQLTIATITIVNKEGNKKPDLKWMKRVNERNDFYNRYAKENNIKIDDLHTISTQIDKKDRYIDGTHYLPEGYKKLATQVSEFIKTNL